MEQVSFYLLPLLFFNCSHKIFTIGFYFLLVPQGFVVTVLRVYYLCTMSHKICAALSSPAPRSTVMCLALLILRPAKGNR